MQEDFMRRVRRCKNDLEKQADSYLFGEKATLTDRQLELRRKKKGEEYPILTDRQLYERRRREYDLEPIEYMDNGGRLFRPEPAAA